MQPQRKDSPSFFDPKTLIAVAAVAIVYFGWQSYLQKKYPGYGQVQSEQTTTEPQEKITADESAKSVKPSGVDTKSEVMASSEEKTFSFSDEKVSFVLSSQGMGLKDFTITGYQDKVDKANIKIGNSELGGLFEMRWPGTTRGLNFHLTEQAPGHFIGTAQVGETTIKRELKYNKDNSSFSNTIWITNPGDEVKNGFSLVIPDKIHVPESSSILFPSYEHQDFFISHNGGKKETVNFSNAKDNVSEVFPTTSLVSVSSQYFAAAILDKSEVIPEVRISSEYQARNALAELVYKPVQLKPEMMFTGVFYAGPKAIDLLKAVDPELADIIDFGFFGFIARPLLYIMKAFHSVVGNWGFAIILLTLLVRLCVLPFNIMSMRSMKAMQKVQPLIQSIREKYKEDPMRLNQEMMAVMKQNGANPMGGCLPMLLQIPIFFALYRVIGSSIELYNSPFIFWINDLSSHDKFYVLPVVSAIVMYLQQKMTPSTMDPTQAKIMAFMPVVFSLFMLQLPSGLTLYMAVSTLFGVIQQYLIMRDTKKA